MKQLLLLTRFFAADEIRRRTPILLGVLVFFFALFVKGCGGADMNVNGESVGGYELISALAKGASHVYFSLLLLLLSFTAVRNLRRAQDEGALLFILTRPVKRFSFYFGNASALFVIYFIAAALLAGLNTLFVSLAAGSFDTVHLYALLPLTLQILFALSASAFLAMLLPEIAALLAVVMIAAVSAGLLGVNIADQALSVQGGVPQWLKITSYVWPSLAANQSFAFAEAWEWKAAWPALNLLVWNVILFTAGFTKFNKKDF